MILLGLIRSSRTNTKKRGPFHHRELECQSRRSRDPGVIGKFGLGVQNEAGQRLTEVLQENILVVEMVNFPNFTCLEVRLEPELRMAASLVNSIY